MDIRKVKKLIELLEESGIAEIEIQEGEESVRISRYGSSAVAAPVAMAPIAAAPVAAPVAAAPAVETAAPVADASSENAVTSPMVGTFYLSSSPGAAPFSTVGQTVKTGDVICIIEAMKIMNQIESDRDGVIKSILAEDGNPIEFGQPLFIIE